MAIGNNYLDLYQQVPVPT